MRNEIVNWIRDWFEENGPGAPAVIGISGGLDSSLVAALCTEALGKERVIGVLLPSGEQHDIQDALDLVEHLDIAHIVVNIEDIHQGFMETNQGKMVELANQLVKDLDLTEEDSAYLLASGNTQARIRMSYLYGISQMMGGRVSNNCNKSERFIGYATLWGDDTGDFAPLRDLTKREVVTLAREMGLPNHLIDKVPVDGLDNNRKEDGSYATDEEAMGFTYKQLDDYIDFNTSGDKDVDALIEAKHKASEFKRRPIAQYTKGGNND